MKDIYYKTTASGLTLCCIRKPHYREKQGMVAVACGSENVKLGNTCLPYGTAHYLEHLMFNSSHAHGHGNIFDAFTSLGAQANAYTTTDTTAYYFTCTDNFNKALTLLCHMVSNPCITAKAVEKERGIIASEITMYKDEPYWQAYFGTLKGLYGDSPVAMPIAGSIEDIERIGVREPEALYAGMYAPNNVIVVAAGDIDPEAFFLQAEAELTLAPRKAAVSHPEIPEDIYQVSTKRHMKLASPIFTIGFRERDRDMSPLMRRLTALILMDILAGKGSVLYEKLYTSGLVTAPLSTEYIQGKDWGASLISGSSDKPEILLSRLMGEVSNILGYGISERYLKRMVEKHKGELLRHMDSLSFCCSFATDCYVKSIKMLDFFHKCDSIDSEQLTERLASHFRADSLSMCEILPEAVG